jgi:two-component system sensor histidine kinase/response regulator
MTKMSIPEINKSTILIVDDNVDNLKVLGMILQQNGYDIAVAKNGNSALELVKNIKIDLILLDIMMPGMDGFELCRQIKSINFIKDIPVIFLTAKTESEDVINAFKIGAVDYITKPFQKDELLARIHTHIELEKSKNIIREQSEELKKTIEQRDKIYSIIAHDLRSPVISIQSVVNLWIENDEYFIQNHLEELQTFKHTIDSLYLLLENLLLWSNNIQNKLPFNPEFYSLDTLINPCLQILKKMAMQKNIIINKNYNPDLLIFADQNMMMAVFRNLISNALKFTPENGNIYIKSEQNSDSISIIFEDTGIGMNKNIIEKIINENNLITNPGTNLEKGHGFGLAISKEFIKKHQGKLLIQSQPGKGSKFIVNLSLKNKSL